jgi:hypothetical protein
VIIERAGHNAANERPEEVLAAVRHFMDERRDQQAVKAVTG